MSINLVEYGIRITVNGNRPAAEAVDQVAAANNRLGAAAQRAGEAIGAVQGRQATSTTTMQAAGAASQAAARSLDQVATSASQAATQAERVGRIVQTSQAAQSTSAAALVAAQSDLTAASRSQGAQMETLAGRHRGVDEAARRTNGTFRDLGVSTGQLNNAMRQVPAQFTDIVTSLQAGQAPLQVLLQQGGQLRDSFGSTGAAARALGSYVMGLITPWTAAAAAAAVLTVAWHQGAAEQRVYAETLIMTGNASATTADRMADMAARISSAVGTQAAAAEALNAVAGSGRVAGDNLEYFSTVAVKMERAVGKSVAETAKDLADLGRAPLQASEKLNEQYRYLTAAVHAQIKALLDQGRTEEAAALAQNTYAAAFDKRSTQVMSKLGFLERSWLKVKDAAKSGWDAMLDLGREETESARLQRIQNVIALKQQGLTKREQSGEGDSRIAKQLRGELELLRQTEAQLIANQKKRDEDAKKQGEDIARNEALIAWQREGDKYLTRRAQLQRDLNKAEAEGAAAGVSKAEIEQRKAQIRKTYGDLNNEAVAGLEAQRNVEKQATANRMADLESRHKQELIAGAAFVAAKRDLQLQDLASEERMLRKKADFAAGKSDLAERRKYLGQLQELEVRRKGVIQQAQNELDEYARAATKAIAEQSKAWANASATERGALQDEIALFGRSAEARRIAAEQLKVDAELRQLLLNWQKQGHVFTAQEIADLERSAAARKEAIAAIMGQRQALAGAEQLRQENQRFAAEAIVDERARAARLLEIDADVWRERIKLAGDGTEAQRRLQEQFDQWYANRQLAPVTERWKNVVANLDNDFRDGFRNMLEHGHDAWKSFATALGSTLKASLADALYQTFIKKYVVQIVTSLAGTLSGAGVQAALTGQAGAVGGVSASQPISMAQAASNLYSALKPGGGFEQSIANGVQSLFDKVGLSQGSGAPGQAAQWAGRAGGTVAGYMFGSSLNSAISGQYQVGSGFQTVEKIGIAAASYFAGPIGGAIAGAISGLINRAFGMGDKKVTATGMRGTVSDAGVVGSNYQTWHQDGGWFRSDRGGTETTAFSADVAKQFAEGYAAIKAASLSFAQDLGLSVDAVKSYSKEFNVALTNDAAANQKAIADLFGTIGDEMAQRLLPNLGELSKAGEAASATLERLAGEFKATNQVAQLLGSTAQAMFGAVGIESAVARERLIELSGGVDALGRQAAFFAQNFLTEAERLAPVSAALDQALASLGLRSIPTTREQFKALVNDLINSGAAATEAGAKQLASLMALAEAFAQVHPEVDRVTSTVTGARAALVEAYRAESDELQRTRDRLATFAAGLRGLRDSTLLGDLSPLTPMQKYAEARAQFERTVAAARSGDEAAQANFQSAYQAFLNASRTVNASGAAYQRDFAYAQAAIEEAIGWSEKQVNVAQASLDALREQVSGLVEVKAAVMTVSEAVNNLAVAMGGAGAGVAAGSQRRSIELLYQSMLGRAPDAGGLEFWQGALSKGVSIGDIAAAIAKSSEYGRVVNGSHANGLGYVPFDGYVAELHQGEAVLTAREASDYRAAGAMSLQPLVQRFGALCDGMVAELRGLREDQEEQTDDLALATSAAADESANKIVQALGTSKSGQMRETRVYPI